MNFNSLAFLVFMAVFLTVYFYLRGRARLYFILCASYLFYGWWDFRYLGLIMISTGIDYLAGIRISRSGLPRERRIFLVLSIAANLAILFTFKYFNFFAQSLQGALLLLGLPVQTVTLNVLLPVGISFYTFQSMSYTIDVYQRKIPCEKDPAVFAAYISFFPQLVAGPIERAASLLPQFKNLRRPTVVQIREGVTLILWGYFMKVVVADNIGTAADYYFDNSRFGLSRAETVAGVLSFALQIYGDFSGYSRIARGTAKILGIELRRNFKHPYFALHPSDFWKRWHISLSTWLRDYLYIPLGGSQRGRWMTLRNLMATMLLGGLWHGASWVFVLWGFYHGVLLVGQRAVRFFIQTKPGSNPGLRGLSRAGTFFLVLYGWLIFRCGDLAQLGQMHRILLSGRIFPGGAEAAARLNIIGFWLVVFYAIVFLVDRREERRGAEIVFAPDRPKDYVYAGSLLLSIYLLAGNSDAFIYFQF